MAANPSSSFTRPNDTNAYTSGDLVANNVTNTSVTPMSWVVSANPVHGNFVIPRVRMKHSTTTTTNGTFRLHLYNSLPTVTNGDNGAWTSIESGYLGCFDITADKAFSDGAGGQGVPTSGTGTYITIDAGGTSPFTKTIYGLLEVRAAYAPGAQEVFTLTLETQILT